MDVLYPAKELVCTLSSGSDTERRRKLAAQLANLAVTAEGLTVVIKQRKMHGKWSVLYPIQKIIRCLIPVNYFISVWGMNVCSRFRSLNS